MEKKSDKQWQYAGDISPEDYGGKWFRRTHARVFQVIELENCKEWGDGASGYYVSLSLVDLDKLGPKEIASARRCCGIEDETLDDAWLAVTCYEYGCKAPLDSWSGNAYGRLLREARREAHALKRDADALAECMERPVNAIGSTAEEYMTGDINSAILRGLSEGRKDAEILARMGCLSTSKGNDQ
jgi:hypothetical protein